MQQVCEKRIAETYCGKQEVSAAGAHSLQREAIPRIVSELLGQSSITLSWVTHNILIKSVVSVQHLKNAHAKGIVFCGLTLTLKKEKITSGVKLWMFVVEGLWEEEIKDIQKPCTSRRMKN